MGVQNLAPLPDGKTTELFLRTAFAGKPDDSRILIWTLQGRLSRTFTNIDAAIAYVDECVDKKDVYFGVGLGSEDVAKNRRFRLNQVSGLIGLHIDLDVKDEAAHKKRGLPETKEEAYAFLDELDLAPTFVIDSGHGFQVYWLLEEPWMFNNPVDRKTAEQYVQHWQLYVHSMALKQHGWSMDHTHDLPRVMRIPGTVNWKEADKPVPATIVDYNPSARYVIGDIVAVLEKNQEIANLSPKSFSGERDARKIAEKIVVDPLAEPPALKFNALMQSNKAAHDAFYHKRDGGDLPSASEFDFALAIAAMRQVAEGDDGLMHLTWSDQDITDLMIAHRRNAGFEVKDRASYYAKTIENARCKVDQEDTLADVNMKLDSIGAKINEAKAAAVHKPATVASAATLEAPERDVVEEEEEEEDDADLFGGASDDSEEEDATQVTDTVGDGFFAMTPAEIEAYQKKFLAEKNAHQANTPQAAMPDNVTPMAKATKKGKKGKGDNGIVSVVASIDTTGMDQGEARRLILDHLSDLYKPITFKRIIKILSDPPQYRFEFDVHGKLTNLTVKSLASVVNMREFRVAVGGATDQLMPQIKQQDWDKHVQAMLNVCETEEIGEEATDVGSVNSWLNGYIESSHIEDEWDGSFVDEGQRTIVKYKGDHYLFLNDILYWLRVHRSEKISPQALGALFKNRKMAYTALPMQRGKHRTTRSAWVIPSEIMLPFLDPPEKTYGDTVG